MRDILSWLTFSNACVAQLVEQRIRNAQVAGSSPAASSTKPRHFRRNDGVFVTFLGALFFQTGEPLFIWCLRWCL